VDNVVSPVNLRSPTRAPAGAPSAPKSPRGSAVPEADREQVACFLRAS
jgi:hypothetical protein